jgi:prepilin signal peptidase PulO-like enzyme (type II secretory pathway)
LVELITATLFCLIWIFSQNPAFAVFYLVLASFFMVIFIYDLKHYLIPDAVVFSAILTSGVWYLISGLFLDLYTKQEMLSILYAALGAAVFFLILVLITKGRGMGVGDIKLAFLMGLVLGWPRILVALAFAFFSGALIGLLLIALNKKKFKSEVPFGPFLATGTFFAIFFGSWVINWYLNL